MAKNIFLIISALFPIVNPLGGSPIFLSFTGEYSTSMRRVLSRQIAISSFFLLLGSYLLGTYVLAFFGISLPVVQIGGGLIVISSGWAMLKTPLDHKQEHHEVQQKMNSQEAFDHSFYPLTLPLTVGPGSISVAVTLGANATQHYENQHLVIVAAAIIGCLVIALSVFLCYRFADYFARILGPTGMSVFMRLSTFLLICIGVQIVWNGVSALAASLR